MNTSRIFRQSILAIALSAALSNAGFAQDHSGHDHDHDGHEHGAKTPKTAKPNLPAPNLPAPDFVFTEAPDDHALGSNFAPITMITYASVTCSHCGGWFSNVWPKVKADLVETGKIRFVLRELPTAPQALSMTGFALAECAPKDDYMAVIEYQMENQAKIIEQTKKGDGAKAYAKVAKIAGLKGNEEIGACLSNPANTAHIQLSAARATAGGVSGVPYFFINGTPYKGDQSAFAFTKHINNLLENSSSTLP